MARIFLTHCSAKKATDTGTAVAPDLLYTATPTQRFIRRCKDVNVSWAIFSDLYGVWFPDVRHRWYEKDPSTVTESEFSALLRDFDAKLSTYSEIYFYCNPGRFHPLYRRLLQESALKARIALITHLWDIL
ncbi:MAG: hypothetical protein WBQ76_01365 [Candidatus Korobacteraceae bacterium]